MSHRCQYFINFADSFGYWTLIRQGSALSLRLSVWTLFDYWTLIRQGSALSLRLSVWTLFDYWTLIRQGSALSLRLSVWTLFDYWTLIRQGSALSLPIKTRYIESKKASPKSFGKAFYSKVCLKIYPK